MQETFAKTIQRGQRALVAFVTPWHRPKGTGTSQQRAVTDFAMPSCRVDCAKM